MLRALFFLARRGFKIDIITTDAKSKHNALVVGHNLWENFALFLFSRGRIERLLYLLELSGASHKGKTLCVGPKNEGELMLFRSHGFTDVIGIDLFSYCPSILVMDVHSTTFPDSTFDTINCGWVLPYLYDLPKAIREISRIAKPGAVIACGLTPPPPGSKIAPYQGVITNTDEILHLFGANVEHVFFRDDVDKTQKQELVLRLKK
jgi:SAM-dependent methyltransferase